MTTFIIPGVFGSDPEHWQSWMEKQLDDATRIHQAQWSQPSLSEWSETLIQALDQAPDPVWLIAHSFGCLVSVLAGVARPSKVAGAFFVAPADPARFGARGYFDVEEQQSVHASAAALIPGYTLPFPTMVVASENDPWVKLTTAAYWAHAWGGRFVSIGNAGHINVRSGYGPWPLGLELYYQFRGSHDNTTHANQTKEELLFSSGSGEVFKSLSTRHQYVH